MIQSLFIALGISIGLNFLFFIFAFWLKSDIFTDITYASTFLLTSLIVMIINKSYNPISYVLLILISLWSFRLGIYLMIRIWKNKVDHRFDNIRNSFWKFGAFWFLQAITVWLVNMATYISMALGYNGFNYYSIIFIILSIFFLIMETVSDIQKWNFTQKNPGKFIKTGLWKVSRHPNYFGEYNFWWMLFGFILIGDYQNLKLIGLIGPVYITFSLYFISGLPLTEKETFKLFGKDPEYIKYLNKTSTMIPWLGKKGYKDKWIS